MQHSSRHSFLPRLFPPCAAGTASDRREGTRPLIKTESVANSREVRLSLTGNEGRVERPALSYRFNPATAPRLAPLPCYSKYGTALPCAGCGHVQVPPACGRRVFPNIQRCNHGARISRGSRLFSSTILAYGSTRTGTY